MALVREVLRSPLRDLTVVAYGGPDVGMLCAAGKVKKLIYGFVSLDAIPVEPWFRRAREGGQLSRRMSWTRACCSGACAPPACACRSCRLGWAWRPTS